MIKKLKKNEEGFKLVELIVVMIILATLAALLVPALVSYIDEAKDKQLIVNGRTCLVAAQAAASEEYGTGGDFNTLLTKYVGDDIPVANCVPTKDTTKAGVIASVSYTENGKTATWTKDSGKWVVSSASAGE